MFEIPSLNLSQDGKKCVDIRHRTEEFGESFYSCILLRKSGTLWDIVAVNNHLSHRDIMEYLYV